MDVSRIDAYNPNRYDWSNMTAREIIKHDDDGDEVPALYLDWARDFLNSINADDVTTYEIAVSQKKSAVESQPEGNNKEDENNINVEEQKLSKAQQERKDLENSGASLYEIAKNFRTQSNKSASDSFSATMLLASLKDKSETEIQDLAALMLVLEHNMDSIFENLDMIKNLNEVKDSEEDNNFIVMNAYNKGQELNEKALKGHRDVSMAEDNLHSIGSDMESTVEVFDTSMDYGKVTLDVASRIPDSVLIYGSLKVSTTKAGNKALESGNTGISKERESVATNNDNIEQAGKNHDYITEKSGIEPPKKNKSRNISQSNKTEEDNTPPPTKDMKKEDLDDRQKEDIKKENKDLPVDRETRVKLEDEDKNVRGDIVKKASKMTTPQDAPSKDEFADNSQRTEALNEFERARENDGADERTATIALRADSINADNSAIRSIGVAGGLAQMSQDAYNEIDQNIQDLMNEINSTQEELKNEIRAISLTNKTDGISRVNQLNEQLRSYGINAQSLISGTEGVINGYASELENIGDDFNNAISRGNTAISGGAEIIANSAGRWLAFKLVNEIIGTSAMNVGNKAVQDGNIGISQSSHASSIITSNLLSLANLKSEIQSRTGVENASARIKIENDNNENTINEELVLNQNQIVDITKPNLEKPKEKVKNTDKAVKIAQNDGTDTTDKLHTDINAIIDRKVRNGEIKMG